MTELLWWLLLLQALMGLVDIVLYREVLHRLPFRTSARRDLRLYSGRSFCYALAFLLLACAEPTGAWTWLLVGALLIAICVTLLDGFEDDRLPEALRSEQVLHRMQVLNFGVLMALLVPVLWGWANLSTSISLASYGFWTPLFVVAATGFALFSAKDLMSARRLERWSARSDFGDLDLVVSAADLGRSRSILVTGATGLIGSRLVPAWIAAGHSVTVLTRRPRVAAELGAPLTIVTSFDQLSSAMHFETVVHLAGEPVAGGLWSESRKKYLLESRAAMPKAIGAWLARTRHKPEVWLSASAIGFYGISDSPDRAFTENDSVGAGFAAHLCECIENTSAENAGSTRLVTLRIGLVLAVEGGYLAKLLPAVDLLAGVIFGSGRQWQSWIHRDDAVRAIDKCLSDVSVRGPVNLVAPAPERANELMKSLGRRLARPVFMHVPGFALRLVAGDFADELILGSQRVAPEALSQAGFKFRYPTLDSALDELFG